MNKTTRGALLLIAGLILVAAASVLYLLNERQDELAGKTAGILLEQLQLNESFGPEMDGPAPSFTPEGTSQPAISVPPAEEPPSTQPEEPPAQPSAMPVKLVAGYESVGVLRIPALGLELPVLDNWDYDRLKLAPCRYTGTAAGGDLILMGHNYRSHFKPLYQAEPGAAVEFTDVNGVRYSYVVDRIDTIKGSETEKLPADYELSLFTCTPGGQSRLVVRCRAITP